MESDMNVPLLLTFIWPKVLSKWCSIGKDGLGEGTEDRKLEEFYESVDGKDEEFKDSIGKDGLGDGTEDAKFEDFYEYVDCKDDEFKEYVDSEAEEFYEAEADACICGKDKYDKDDKDEDDEYDGEGCICQCLDRDSVSYLDRRLEDSVMLDLKDVFVRVLKHIRRCHGTVYVLKFFNDPLTRVFHYDAVNCLEAVMNGETAGILEINDVNAVPYFQDSERVPILHRAASSLAVKIIKMCLPGNEAQLNLRLDFDGTVIKDLDGSKIKGFRPLNFAIRSCLRLINFGRRSRQWISEAVLNEPLLLAFKLIFHCTPLYSYADAEIGTLLASEAVEIEKDFFKYLKNKKLPELTILLMLAHDSLMPCLERDSKIREIIWKEMTAVEAPIFSSTCDVDRLTYEAQKKAEIEAVVLLLEIFNRIGDKIGTYLLHTYHDEVFSDLDLVRGLCRLLEESGFDAKLEPDEILRESLGHSRSRRHEIVFDDDDITTKSDRVEDSNMESKQPLAHCLVDPQELTTVNYQSTRNFSSGPSSTLHFTSGCRDFGFTTANKVGFFNRKYHCVGASIGLGFTTDDEVKGVPLKLHLKNGKSSVRRITSECSWASYLQFNGESVISMNSGRRLLWITKKFGCAL